MCIHRAAGYLRLVDAQDFSTEEPPPSVQVCWCVLMAEESRRAEGDVDGAQATLVTQDMGDLGSIPLSSWWNMNLTLPPLREY